MLRKLSLCLVLLAGASAPARAANLALLVGQDTVFNVGALNIYCRRPITVQGQLPPWIELHGEEFRFTPTKADVGPLQVKLNCAAPELITVTHPRQRIENGQVINYFVNANTQVTSNLAWNLDIYVNE